MNECVPSNVPTSTHSTSRLGQQQADAGTQGSADSSKRCCERSGEPTDRPVGTKAYWRTVQLDEPLRDRQAEAGATELDRDGLIALKEWLEDESGTPQSPHPTQIATNRHKSTQQCPPRHRV